MSSVKREFALRNSNNSALVPQRLGTLDAYDISGAAVYALNVSDIHKTNGFLYVDLAAEDLSGALLNFEGQFRPFSPSTPPSAPAIRTILFVLNIDTVASVYPGLEFTIFFKNLPVSRFDGMPFATIGLLKADGAPIPYIVSPPFPPLMGPGICPSITMKSDGTGFSVVSSGPAGWMGVPALSSVLAVYSGLL